MLVLVIPPGFCVRCSGAPEKAGGLGGHDPGTERTFHPTGEEENTGCFGNWQWSKVISCSDVLESDFCVFLSEGEEAESSQEPGPRGQKSSVQGFIT